MPRTELCENRTTRYAYSNRRYKIYRWYVCAFEGVCFGVNDKAIKETTNNEQMNPIKTFTLYCIKTKFL